MKGRYRTGISSILFTASYLCNYAASREIGQTWTSVDIDGQQWTAKLHLTLATVARPQA